MARFLRVRTGRLSILPQPLENGRLQLGFVETVPTDIVRDALIGAAPLISGGVFVTYAGLVRLGIDTLWDGFVNESVVGFWRAFVDLPNRVDYWLWFYLAFTVSSTMLPSSSDRRAWLPVALVLGSLLGLTLIVGAGSWLMENLASPLNMALRGLAIVLGISILLHLVLLVPTVLLRYFLSRLTGYEVV